MDASTKIAELISICHYAVSKVAINDFFKGFGHNAVITLTTRASSFVFDDENEQNMYNSMNESASKVQRQQRNCNLTAIFHEPQILLSFQSFMAWIISERDTFISL